VNTHKLGISFLKMTGGHARDIFVASGKSNKRIFIVMSIIISTSILDIAFTKTYCLSTCLSSPTERLPIFLVIVSIYSIGQYFVLEFVKQKSRNIAAKDLHFELFHRIAIIIQSLLLANMIYTIFGMLVTSYYYTISLIMSILMSYSLAIFMLGLLAQRFFVWFMPRKNLVVLLYGLSSAIIGINCVITTIFVINSLLARPQEVREFLVLAIPFFFMKNSFMDLLNQLYISTSILAFLLTWISTTLLLFHYSKKMGRIRFWTIISLPLIYFLIQFLFSYLNLFNPWINSNPVFFGTFLTLLFALSKPVGGLLFGIAFWTVAKNIRENKVVKDYIIMAAYGLTLLFISNQGLVLVNVPYPPFGLATVSFVGLSSYLLLLGIYSSAISVAQDTNLRKSIRRLAVNETKMLENIGSAHMEHQITSKVTRIAKEQSEQLRHETGVQSSYDEKDIKDYLQMVLDEVNKEKKEKSEP
jgi:hypothetical protein